jgi:nickel-dependent lactate racemase
MRIIYTMVDCWLPYGETEVYVSVEMDYLLGIAEQTRVDPQKPPSEIVAETIADSALEELLEHGATVAIAVENYSSPNAVVQTLKELVKSLVELIIPKDRITFIIGNGEHAKNSSPVIDAIKNASELNSIRIVEHNRDTSDLVDLGPTNRGTPVQVNGAYFNATLKIAVGETRLDQYMGFSGAHNAVVPGVSSIETITGMRKHYFDGKITPGVIELNPIKEDAMEAVKMAGLDYTVNFITNYRGRILAAHAGGSEETWSKAINSMSNHYEAHHEGNADIVLVSAGGSPFDQSLYSASLALLNASQASKKNGTLILLAECGSGLGADAYNQLSQVTELPEFKRRYMHGAEALREVKSVLRNHRVILVSALPGYLVESLGIEPARTANEAYERAIRTRRGRRTVVIPKGLTTLLV